MPPEAFFGRSVQLEQISRGIFQTAKGSPQNLLITGESGIGKTSIAYMAKAIAEKRILWDRTETRPPLLASYVTVQKNLPSAVVLTQVIRELQEAVSAVSREYSFLEDFVARMRKFAFAGTGFQLDSSEIPPAEIYLEAEKTLRTLAKTLSRKNSELGSLCIIVDDLDRMGDFDMFFSFWKTLQDKLAADNCRNLMLVLVGLPEIKDRMSAQDESFPRTFLSIPLEKLSTDESRAIINKILKNGVPLKEIREEALAKLLYYSENHPFLIQEIGYSAFEVSRNDQIILGDVELGIQGNERYTGSVQRLGELFFRKTYPEMVQSESYRELLGLIAQKSKGERPWVLRRNLLASYSKKPSSLGLNLQQLVDKGLIIRNPEKFGEYRLVSSMFQVYVDKIYLPN